MISFTRVYNRSLALKFIYLKKTRIDEMIFKCGEKWLQASRRGRKSEKSKVEKREEESKGIYLALFMWHAIYCTFCFV